ncbi:MAG: YicC/YloC family endoribonuclease [Lachnospirales bacterium]
MLKSMTGFGRSERLVNDRRYSVEMKAVNHKFSEINIKLPRFLNEYESVFREILKSKISRGKVDLYIYFETFAEEDFSIKLNENLAKAYYEKNREVIDLLGLEDDVRANSIINFPDVISVEKKLDDEDALKEFYNNFELTIYEALEKFMKMRETEGEKLRLDILDKLDVFKKYVKEIEKLYPLDIQRYRNNLMEKAKSVFENKEIDENRIVMEVMVYTDKMCVDEEITRLYSHIEQFYNFLDENAPVGRKIDFLIQEMNREVNTIASKSNDINITKNVVELKNILEKIREQVQNIE